MLILLSFDNDANENFANLVNKYPLDAVHHFGTENYLFDSEKNTIRYENDGSLPKRLTFLGHSDKKKYGDLELDAIDFANLLIRELDTASKIDPRIRSSIHSIDLLGCEIGLVGRDGKSYAQVVADMLYAAGYDISVKSFSNLAAENAYPAYTTTIMSPTKKGPMIYSLFRSKESWQAFLSLTDAGKPLMDSLQKISDQLTEIYHYEKKSPDKLKDQEELISQKSVLEKNQQRLIAKLEKLLALRSQEQEIIVSTKDPRKYLDKNPACQFIPRVVKDKAILSHLEQTISIFLEFDNRLKSIQNLNGRQVKALAYTIEQFVIAMDEEDELKNLTNTAEKIDLLLTILDKNDVPVSKIKREGNKMDVFIKELTKAVSLYLIPLIEQKEALTIAIEAVEDERHLRLESLEKPVIPKLEPIKASLPLNMGLFGQDIIYNPSVKNSVYSTNNLFK